MQEKLWPTMKANWAVWPLANFIAFRFLHQDVRILYANIVGVSSLPASVSVSNSRVCRSKALLFECCTSACHGEVHLTAAELASLPSLV